MNSPQTPTEEKISDWLNAQIPAAIREFDQLIESFPTDSSVDTFFKALDPKKRYEMIKGNNTICSELGRKYLSFFTFIFSIITVMAPPMEHGDPLQTAIRQRVFDGISISEKHLFVLTENAMDYYESRAELSRKFAKYPDIVEYGDAIERFDYLRVQSIIQDLKVARYNFIFIKDFIQKHEFALFAKKESVPYHL